MATYQYATKTGTMATVDAASSDEALKSLSTNPNADPHSGVALYTAPPAPTGSSSIGNPVVAPGAGSATTPAPVLPNPQAPQQNESYVNTLAGDLKNTRNALDTSYKTNLDSTQKSIDESQAKIDNLNTLEQTGVIDNVKTLTDPFRADLETKQREALHVNENFEANQKLVNELDSLLTQGNDLITQQKSAGGLASIAIPNLNKTISEVNARAGVIQAVLAARNNQISVAEHLIDRTAAAITADRKDQLSYYNTLMDFYEGKKDAEGKKILNLAADKKTYLNAQINLLQNDLKNSQETVDYIKKLTTDPATALTIAQAGVTLNDTIPEINKKMAEYAYVKSKNDLINSFTVKGFSYMSNPAEIALHPASEMYVTRDAKGNDLTFWKDPSKSTSGTTPEEKELNSFRSDLANVNTLKSAGNREQFIRQLAAKHPTIDSGLDSSGNVIQPPPDGSIAQWVYGTYPDSSGY